MERLTRKVGKEYISTNIDYFELINLDDEEWNKFVKVIEKLGKYEDLEEQGRLIVLPCTIGDTIYEVHYKHKCDICENNNVNCGLRGGNAECVENIVDILERKFDLAHYSIYTQKLRKSYYLTREEAERRLEELSK